MDRVRIADFLGRRGASFVVVLGSDEIASAIAVHLTGSSRRVVVVRDPTQTVLRRGMAFDDAAHDDAVMLGGVTGLWAQTGLEVAAVLAEPGRVAVVDLDLNEVLAIRAPDALVDARPLRADGRVDLRGLADVTVGVGAGFVAGVHCDAVVGGRGGTAGRVTWTGADEGGPGESGPGESGPGESGVGERGPDEGDAMVAAALRAPCDGRWRTPFDVGRRIYRGMTLGRVDGEAVIAPSDGRLLGIVRDDALVTAGLVLVDLARQGRDEPWRGVDARGRAIGAGVARALETASAVARLAATARDDESLH